MSGALIGGSAEAGFLAPTPSATGDDLALDIILQSWIVGITGLPGPMVRPRWQPAPPPMPDQGVNWCAVGLMSTNRDANAWFGHNPLNAGGLGDSTMQRHQDLDVLATFYGTNAGQYGSVFADGAQVEQNRDVLTLNGIALVESGLAQVVPDLINAIWVRRVDVRVSLRQQITRTYPIRTVLTAPIKLTNNPG